MSQPVSSRSNTGNTTKKEKTTEFNPRWKGYVFICLSSLVNFASISDISRIDRRTYWSASMIFGVVSFSLAALILMQDRSQKCLDSLHYTKAKDGYVEGMVLLGSVLWWIVGTAYLTRAGGIAYVADNIYYSAWLSLGSCVYTLNEWSTAKDILSISELTSLSETLLSWWILNISSWVVLGTTIDLHVRLDSEEFDDTAFGIAISIISCVVSFFFLLVHYDFMPNCEEGGWLELSSSFFLILVWTVSLIIMTQDQGLAATVTGSQCTRDPVSLRAQNCTIIIYEVADGSDDPIRTERECGVIPRQVPGSNLYMAVWICFFASVNISLRWKAQQALHFAHAQQERQQQQLHIASNSGDLSDEEDHDSDGVEET